MPQLPAGVPLDVLRELIKASESGNFGGYNALAWHKGYNPIAMELPRNEYGFPQWGGSSATGRGSHGAGAYQFEPALWREFAPGLGISDFTPESQDRVATAAIGRYGIRPWQTNKVLQGAIRDYQQTGRMPQSLVPSPPQPTGSATSALDTLQSYLGPGMPAPPPPQPQPETMMADLSLPNLGFGSWGYY